MTRTATGRRLPLHIMVVALVIVVVICGLVDRSQASRTRTDSASGMQSLCRWRPTGGELHATRQRSFDLRAIAAISRRNAWAAGAQGRTGEGGFGAPFVEHWNGRTWSESTPRALSKRDRLDDLHALSAHDIWGVGETWGGRPLAVHWNGRRWARSTPAAIDAHYRYFNAVDGASTDDVWAVGHATPGPLIEHWNGSSWRLVASPSLPLAAEQLASLEDVSALSPDDAWAVGGISTIGSQSGNGRVLIEHWDGNRWTVEIGARDFLRGQLSSVDAVTSNDVWAVGWDTEGPITIHWDGKGWTEVNAPGHGSLFAVAARAHRDVWSVGGARNHPMLQHWDGRRWTVVRREAPRDGTGFLSDVAVDRSGAFWAVGDLSRRRTFLQRPVTLRCLR